VRLRDASIDDVHLELLLVIDGTGGHRWTCLMRWFANTAYRIHRRTLLTLLRVCYGLGAGRDA
jgi:hypothetical protein